MKKTVAEVRFLFSQLAETVTQKKAKLFVVMPPHTNERLHPLPLQESLANIAKTTIEKKYGGRVFVSREVTRYHKPFPVNDGVTYSTSGAESWAALAAAELFDFLGLTDVPIPPAPSVTMSETEPEPSVNPLDSISPESDQPTEK